MLPWFPGESNNVGKIRENGKRVGTQPVLVPRLEALALPTAVERATQSPRGYMTYVRVQGECPGREQRWHKINVRLSLPHP